MRYGFQNFLAVVAVASAILMLGYTAVAPRALLAPTDEIPSYAEPI
jgi:hypothetical protein